MARERVGSEAAKLCHQAGGGPRGVTALNGPAPKSPLQQSQSTHKERSLSPTPPCATRKQRQRTLRRELLC